MTTMRMRDLGLICQHAPRKIVQLRLAAINYSPHHFLLQLVESFCNAMPGDMVALCQQSILMSAVASAAGNLQFSISPGSLPTSDSHQSISDILAYELMLHGIAALHSTRVPEPFCT